MGHKVDLLLLEILPVVIPVLGVLVWLFKTQK
jgi:hypothetical protein